MLYRPVLSLSNVKRFTLLSLLVILSLILGACQPMQLAQPEAAPATTAPVPYTPREDAPTYGMRGPYAVGVRDFVIEGKDGARPISVSVWYPGLNPDGAAEAVEYMLDYDNPAFPDFAVAGRALRDAEPDISAGPYPLVVHSHGLWQFRQASAWLMEHLASHGFVVMAGDHDDNWGDIMGEPAGDNYVVRPREITRVIDFAETLGADGEFAGMIDLEHIGVTGHSYGAETALLAGGARLDTDHLLNQWCALNPGDPEDPLNDCVTIPPLLDKMAEMAGLDEVPVGPWPDWSDPRVDAVVPLLAGAQYFGPEGLAALHEPVLLVESELDLFYAQSNAYYHPYTLLPAPDKTHVYYERGDHMLFANNCEAMPGLVEQGLGWFCWDSVWDTGRAKDLASHFVTAFLLAELKGDAEPATALAPENVNFPGIQYETTAFDATADAPIQIAQGYAEVNGTHLYYERAGAGEPIVMIHGLGWDTRGWDAQFAEFARHYQVVRYDMRGFGKSDMPTDQPYAHADDLKALMDYLGIDAAHVFGHSFGGEIAINFALAYPEATRSLVLIEPDIQGAQGLPAMTPEEEASFGAAFAALEKGDSAGAALAIVDLHPLVAVAKDVPPVREMILRAFTDYEWFQFLHEDPVVQPAIPSAERIGEITAPTLLVVGDSTTEFQKIEVDRLAEQMPNAQTVLFENSDHFPHLLYPEKFNSVVFDFLANAVTTMPAPEPAPVVALSEGEFTSDALAGNLLGDPVVRNFVIYLPPSYASGESGYPVVYVLHGFTGNQWSMATFQEKMDAMIQNGDVPEMIVVMPDASNTYLGSFYMNSPTIGDYESYITSELVAWVDAHYRTLAQPEGRGVTGCSMGGLGAVRLGLQHPEVYRVVAGVSGPYVQAYHRMLDRALMKIERIPQTMTEMSTQPFEVQAIFALAAAAAPNPNKPPFYLEMPFAEVDGKIQAVAEVIERFGVVYASATVADYFGVDRPSQAILLYHGDQDPMAEVEGARLISTTLTEQGVDHAYLEVNGGGHCNLDYGPVIQFMAEHLSFETAE